MEKDKENRGAIGGVLRKAWNIEPNDDFFHRFIFQMGQIRDCTSPREERPKHGKSYETIFQNLLEAKFVRSRCIALIEAHNKGVSEGKDAYILGHQINVDNPIDDELNLLFKDFFIRGVMAIDRLFSHCIFIGYPVSGLFSDKEKKRVEALEAFPLSKDDPRRKSLVEFVEGNQKAWYRLFREHRTQIVHHGWKLPSLKYIPAAGNKVEVLYPKIHSHEIPALLDICWNNMTNFCEELLVFIASLKLPDHLTMIEIPKENRDPHRPVRFAVRVKEFPDADFHCS